MIVRIDPKMNPANPASSSLSHVSVLRSTLTIRKNPAIPTPIETIQNILLTKDVDSLISLISSYTLCTLDSDMILSTHNITIHT